MNRESVRNHTMAKIAGQSNRTLPVVWLGRVNRYPYPRIKCMKYRNLNQVTRAEIYFFKKRESLVEKINAASWVTVLDLWKWYFRRSLLMNYPKHTTCVMTVGMYIIKKSRFKFLCAYDECNLTTLILRLLEQIEVPRMVDIDILMEIWKNRVSEGRFDLSTFRSERTNEASTLTITPKRSSSRNVGTSSYRYHTATYSRSERKVLRSNLPSDIGDPGRDMIRTLRAPQSWRHLSIAKATKPSNIDANKPLLLKAV
ncbi:hypothetical protein TNCV_983701 [Trichonephila clavipes]|nr:hypothetical protein TNCV_983701 [Trichonephila clavipes]